MAMLSICQRAAAAVAIQVPTAVVGNSDTNIIQMLELLNGEGEDLARRHPWTALQTEATLTTVATEDQGAIETIAPGFDAMLNQTWWDRSKRWPLGGPVSPQHWQQLKSITALGPYYSFRIRGGRMLIIPIPAAGLSFAFEYRSKNWATDAAGAVTKAAFTLDTDLPLLDETLLRLGLIWRFKAAKGLEYAEDMRTYEGRVANACAQDGARRVIDRAMSDGEGFPPRVRPPDGSWSL